MPATSSRPRALRLPLTRLRRYAAVPFVCAAVVAGWKVDHPAPVYRAVLGIEFQSPPAESAFVDKPNPQADPRRSLAATAAAVAEGMNNPAAAAGLHAAGVFGPYDLEPRNSGTSENPYNSIPWMNITADAPDPDTAIKSVAILEAKLRENLLALENQVGVQANDHIVTVPLAGTHAAMVPGQQEPRPAGDHGAVPGRGVPGPEVAGVGAVAPRRPDPRRRAQAPAAPPLSVRDRRVGPAAPGR